MCMIQRRPFYFFNSYLSSTKLDGSRNNETKVSKQFEDLTLDDLEVIATLGMGGFGRVELVRFFCHIFIYPQITLLN